MTVGLFFGSFNPIHNGHLNIAREILKKTEIDSVWMVLSPKSPDKEEVLDKNDRYELMRLALMSESKIVISKVEFNLKTPNYTYLTLLELSKKHPNDNFILSNYIYKYSIQYRNHQIDLPTLSNSFFCPYQIAPNIYQVSNFL